MLFVWIQSNLQKKEVRHSWVPRFVVLFSAFSILRCIAFALSPPCLPDHRSAKCSPYTHGDQDCQQFTVALMPIPPTSFIILGRSERVNFGALSVESRSENTLVLPRRLRGCVIHILKVNAHPTSNSSGRHGRTHSSPPPFHCRLSFYLDTKCFPSQAFSERYSSLR